MEYWGDSHEDSVLCREYSDYSEYSGDSDCSDWFEDSGHSRGLGGMVLSFFIAEVGVLGDYHSFTIDVSGWRLPLIPLRKALADPKLRKRSRRTGRWFLSSVM